MAYKSCTVWPLPASPASCLHALPLHPPIQSHRLSYPDSPGSSSKGTAEPHFPPSVCHQPAFTFTISLLLSAQNLLLAHPFLLSLEMFPPGSSPTCPSLPLWAELGVSALSHPGSQVFSSMALTTQSTSINLCLCPLPSPTPCPSSVLVPRSLYPPWSIHIVTRTWGHVWQNFKAHVMLISTFPLC